MSSDRLCSDFRTYFLRSETIMVIIYCKLQILRAWNGERVRRVVGQVVHCRHRLRIDNFEFL